MTKIVLPAQTVNIDTPSGGIDPIWYEKLSQIVALLNNGIVGQGALATTATTGFGFLPTMALAVGAGAAPTGVPVARPGYVPVVFDITNNKLWIYNGAWRSVTLT